MGVSTLTVCRTGHRGVRVLIALHAILRACLNRHLPESWWQRQLLKLPRAGVTLIEMTMLQLSTRLVFCPGNASVLTA